ncbi:hypothetical protein [Brevundimonas sp. 'scallop']|uniref:hypothetical protein n=1 Tax=Brevundimonas sp. 'scallop' TaxID=2562582 RepID=UPI0013E14136|nr:hypothetical protein [Brevundimonas sp. 'scallop']QIF82242.1 hypothetical protein E4341_11330 [Brevundimonas sp. 'scallop']
MMPVLVLAAALQAAPSPSADDLSPVSDKVLRYLLDGVHLDYVDTVIGDRAQFFFPEGRYVVHGRARSEGRYRVSDGQICTQVGDYSENCFHVFSDTSGRFFVDHLPAPGDGEVSEVRFVPVLEAR